MMLSVERSPGACEAVRHCRISWGHEGLCDFGDEERKAEIKRGYIAQLGRLESEIAQLRGALRPLVEDRHEWTNAAGQRRVAGPEMTPEQLHQALTALGDE